MTSAIARLIAWTRVTSVQGRSFLLASDSFPSSLPLPTNRTAELSGPAYAALRPHRRAEFAVFPTSLRQTMVSCETGPGRQVSLTKRRSPVGLAVSSRRCSPIGAAAGTGRAGLGAPPPRPPSTFRTTAWRKCSQTKGIDAVPTSLLGECQMLSNLPFMTNDLLIMAGMLAVFLGLSGLIFFRRGS